MKTALSAVFVALIASTGIARGQEANAVFVDQIGDASRVTILQEGYRNRIGDSTELRATLGGNGGVVTINQRGNDNVLTRSIMMEGPDNVLDVNQLGDRNSYVYGRTVGASNVISLTQNGTGNAATTWIRGEANLLTILQEGRENSTALAAAGSDNRLTAWAKGDRNQVEMSANGARNVMNVIQQGIGHVVGVSHTGSGAVLSITQR